jgi:hypothetical protein
MLVLAVLATWCSSPDAHWVDRVVHAAALPPSGCTGSALTVKLPGGSDLYVWAFTGRRLAREPNMQTRTIAGARVHLNRFRAAWRVGRRNVWIQAGPTTRRLPLLWRWRRLVAASRTTS